MSLTRKIGLISALVMGAGVACAAYYAYEEGFTNSWRQLVSDEFERRGYYAQIDKLTLDPVRGFLAEGVRFYQESSHRTEIASIDSVILDVDLSRVVEKEITVKTLQFRDAELSLPIDPSDPDSERLDISGCSATILMPEDRFEIVNAEASLQGIRVTLKGALYKPGPDALPEDKQERNRLRRRQLEGLKEQRALFGQVLKQLGQIEVDPEQTPRLELEVHGDLGDLETLRATARLSGRNLQRQNYKCRQLDALLTLENSVLTLNQFYLRDEKGRLQVWAEWPLVENKIDFDIKSSADLTGLISSVYPEPALREIVFYEPPRLSLEGQWDLNRKIEGRRLPARLVGEFSCDRFGSLGGKVFTAFSTDFSLVEDRYYFRNIRLEHKSGLMQAHGMYDPNGVRYEAEIKLDPGVFSPFLQSEGSKRFLDRWRFTDDSTIYVGFAGEGPGLEPGAWRSSGEIELRKFQLGGVDFDHLETHFESEGKQHIFRDVRLRRPEGEARAPYVSIDHAEKRILVENAYWDLNLIDGIRAFNPGLSEYLKRYRFQESPVLTLSGIIDARKREDVGDGERFHDFIVNFSSDGAAHYDFLGKTLPLEEPHGQIRVLKSGCEITEVAAKLFGGSLRTSFVSKDLRTARDFTTDVRLKDVRFRDLSDLYSDYQSTTGNLTGSATLSGTLGDLKSITGSGEAAIENGDVFAIPMFGPLSDPIGSILPLDRAGYTVAREASASFTLNDGILATEDLEALTDGFRLTGNGQVNCVDKTVDFTAAINTRLGLTRILLTPVSKLLEYHCEGTLEDPEWRPKLLPRMSSDRDGASNRNGR